MKVYCHKCGGIHEKGICPLVDKTPNTLIPQSPTTPPKSKRLCDMNEEERIIQQFYNSKEWRKKRLEIINRSFGMCEVCWNCYGRIREGKEVHHIVKLRTNFNLRLESSNLILVCIDCHKEIEDYCCSDIKDLLEFIKQKKNK